jgi:MSHA biogenesis protein MshJ
MNGFLGKVHARFLVLDEFFRAREVRERAIISGAVVALTLFSIDSTLIQPVSAKLTRNQMLTEQTTIEITQLEGQRRSLKNVELSDDERALLQRKQLLERQLAEIDSQIKSEISELVPPKAIISLLEEMLTPDSGLQLISLTSREPHRVGTAALHDSDATVLDSTKSLFRHGLRIEIEGDFAATLDYLERVEASKWHLLWDRFEYRVKEFPTANIIIDLHTVSEQEEWLGV